MPENEQQIVKGDHLIIGVPSKGGQIFVNVDWSEEQDAQMRVNSALRVRRNADNQHHIDTADTKAKYPNRKPAAKKTDKKEPAKPQATTDDIRAYVITHANESKLQDVKSELSQVFQTLIKKLDCEWSDFSKEIYAMKKDGLISLSVDKLNYELC